MPFLDFDLLQLLVVGVAFFLGSLMMHLIAAKVVYGHPKFLNRVAIGVMSSAFVKMQTGKLLKKVVSGIVSAFENIKLPDLPDLIPQSIKDKIPAGLLEKAKGADLGQLAGLMKAVPGMGDGGGMAEIVQMLQGMGGLAGGEGGSPVAKGKYKPGE